MLNRVNNDAWMQRVNGSGRMSYIWAFPKELLSERHHRQVSYTVREVIFLNITECSGSEITRNDELWEIVSNKK